MDNLSIFEYHNLIENLVLKRLDFIKQCVNLRLIVKILIISRYMKIKDFATDKLVKLSPEENVRQEYERILVESYGYTKSEMEIEVKIPRGTGYFPDRADICVFKSSSGRDPTQDILGIVETKRPERKDGISQLKSYMTATSAIWGVWTNGDNISYVCRRPGKTDILDDYINDIPSKGQSISDIGKIKKAELKPFERQHLKSVFRRILRTLYANTNISRREKLGNEMIKLIFSKIEDEKTYFNRLPDFRASAGEPPIQVKERVLKLFERVKKELKDDGVFSEYETITLDPRSVAWVVGQMERRSLLKTDTDVVGDAFEVFAESRLAGEKGEFFTPRGVIKLAVELTKPKPEEIICDPACGSGGFLIQAMKYIWKIMEKEPQYKDSPRLEEQKKKMASRVIFGIDKESDLVKIAKAYMAISGDGRSNVLHENSLHSAEEFSGFAKEKFVQKNKFRTFNVILTNPPYGTRTKVAKTDTKHFALGHKWVKKSMGAWEKSGTFCDRDPYVLFIERCLDMLSENGRLAIVLPETLFHAPKTEYIRHFIMKSTSIEAVIGLPHNTFRPHCNAKTCLLILKKRIRQTKKVVMANPKEMGHDHNGHPLLHPDTKELWDDLPTVIKELSCPESKTNKFTFTVPWDKIKKSGNLIPSYYQGLMFTPEVCENQMKVRIGDLVDEGILGAWDGHGSPSSESKGRGSIPYIRVSDIVNWELYRNPVSGISKNVYDKMVKNKKKPKEGDILFVRRGSYRIGTVAMASSRDSNVLLTRELLTFRILKTNNPYKINSFYLLALLSSKFVQDQINSKVFVDTTLPNIGDRWKELILPIHKDTREIQKISVLTEKSIRAKWSAQNIIQTIRNEMGDIIT